MLNVARHIAETTVQPGALGIFWIGQAGYVFKDSRGKVVYVDPYLSDSVERLVGFKRIMASPISPDEVECDLYVTTHHHEDHLDIDTVSVLAGRPNIVFAGPPTCLETFRKLGVPPSQIRLLQEGIRQEVAGIGLTAVYADHGVYAPDAVGVIFDFAGIRVYHMGDTSYHPEKLAEIRPLEIDVLLPPINGRYLNLDAEEAARATGDIAPRVVIPSHFWMFIEHDGDPGAFKRYVREFAPGTQPVVLTQGSCFMYRREGLG